MGGVLERIGVFKRGGEKYFRGEWVLETPLFSNKPL